MKTNEELAEEMANYFVRCDPKLGDSTQNKLDRLIIKQACIKMANYKDKQFEDLINGLPSHILELITDLVNK